MTGPPGTTTQTVRFSEQLFANEDAASSEAPNAQQLIAAIDKEIASYAERLKNHPIKSLLVEGSVPRNVLQEFAATQYRECLLWVPMLALMKDHAQHKRLRRALRANMLCEAGASATSHVELCRRFVESMGIKTNSKEFYGLGANLAITFEEFGYITTIGEAETAGWILVAEELTAVSFALFLNGFQQIPGVDLQYLTEHVTVDCDEHAKWMREGVEEILSHNPADFDEIMTGIHAGAHAVLRIPDVLYAKALTQRPIRHKQSLEVVHDYRPAV